VTTFFDEQSLRDAQRAMDIANGQVWFPHGDECRRWSLCGRCDHESPEMRTLYEQDQWELDHECFGCDATDALWNAEPIEAEELIFPYPAPCEFARRLEELPQTIHVRVRHNEGYVSGRTPQARSKAA
jgi:hypothetical protein